MHEFMRKLSLFISLVLLVAWGNINITAAGLERPNILWITAEDINPSLGCYGVSSTTSQVVFGRGTVNSPLAMG